MKKDKSGTRRGRKTVRSAPGTLYRTITVRMSTAVHTALIERSEKDDKSINSLVLGWIESNNPPSDPKK